MDFIGNNLVAVIAFSIISSIVFIYWMIRTHYLWMDAWYSAPLIGTISRLAKDTSRYAGDKSWTNSERRLCHDYKQFFKVPSREQFDQCVIYLQKSHDLGRTPLRVWLVVVLFFLVMAEGLGFSYLLGTWMAMEGSESTRQLLMFAIVTVLCVILMLVTHAAGHQLYKSNLLNSCNKAWRDNGQTVPLAQNVSLNNDQHIDDDMPSYTQCVSRVAGPSGSKPSYVMVIVAAIVIVVIAVASTWMRYQHLEAVTASEVANLTQSVPQGGMPADAGNPFATNLPDEVKSVQAAADNKAQEDIKDATTSEGLAAFIMLGFIFVVTQVVGIFAGYKYGFAGKESDEAYKATQGFTSYDGLMLHIDPIIQIARASLQRLQQKMSEKHGIQSLELSKTFDHYLREDAQKTFNPNNVHASAMQHATIQAANSYSVSAVSSSQVAQQQGKVTAPTVQNNSIEDYANRADAFTDKEERMQYLNTLPTDVLVAVQEFRKAKKQKANEDEEKRRAALLDEED